MLIEQLADDDRNAIALTHLLNLIDSTSDEERENLLNTAIVQAYARTQGGESTEEILAEMASWEST